MCLCVYLFIYLCIYCVLIYLFMHLFAHYCIFMDLEMRVVEGDAREERVEIRQQVLPGQVPHLEKARGFSLDGFIY